MVSSRAASSARDALRGVETSRERCQDVGNDRFMCDILRVNGDVGLGVNRVTFIG
jgi:hypothetical protein